MKAHTFELNTIDSVAQKLLESSETKLICFYGPMGAGKTTLIKALIKQLGGIDNANSPTFGLVNEYHDREGKLLAYHFDFYRIKNEEEALDMGLEDYLNYGAYIFIEWPEQIPNLLPEQHQKIRLHFIDEKTRRIEF